LNVKDWALLRIVALETMYAQPHTEPGFMTEIVAVHLYAQWERYTEDRLTEALVKHPSKFLDSNGIRRLKSIHKNLALVLVREGHRYVDFQIHRRTDSEER
jgi:hypothetical protein